MKRFATFLCGICGVVFAATAFAQAQKIVGVVTLIADDKSAITVDSDGKKITLATDPEFVDMAYFEVGDKVEIEAQENAGVLKAESFRYLFDDVADDKDDPDQAAGHSADAVPAAETNTTAAAAAAVNATAAS